jgi:hypothetical protein
MPRSTEVAEMANAAVKEKNKKEEAEVQASGCQHHWSIETPAGSLSKGRCRRCGEERDFRNSAETYMWEKDSGGGTPWRGKRASKTTSDDSEQISVTRGTIALN